MSDDITTLATAGVQQLHPYLPGKPVEELERELGISGSIKLASNENPLGPSPQALRAIQEHAAEINFYPDGGGYRLSQKLAESYGIGSEGVTLGNGSNDILELVTRAFLTSEHAAVFSAHAFAVYPIVVQAVGAEAQVADALPEDHDLMPLGHDPEALLAAIDDRTRIIFIANPNNPTGTWLETEVLHDLVSRVPDDVVVVLDLAYQEYMPDELRIDVASWLGEFPNLLITGTFSKIHALAGLRIGYGLSSPAMADILNRVRQPFNTNLLAQAAAIASLDDRDHVLRSVETNDAGKTYLIAALEELGLRSLPTMGNFISIDFGRDAMPLYDALLKQGVIVRPVANYAMPNYLRVTIGTREQNERFIASLKSCI